MFNRTFRVGTRTSPLALRQVEEVLGYLKKIYPHTKLKIVGIDTYGDKDKTTPLSDIEETDFFTREIEQALLRGEIDFAVHSAKDLADEIPQGLVVAAITNPIEPYDALISKDNLKIDELRLGAKIGASSLRRKTQLKKYRADFNIIDIRGNIQERLERLDKDGLDAIIVAACALVRLGLEERIVQRVPFKILTPHPLQGALAIEVKQNDFDLIRLFSGINNREAVRIWKQRKFI